MNPLVEVRNLSVHRGSRHVLDEVAFDLMPGEFTAFLGLNGAGKSTLLETLAGLLTGYAGTCAIAAREVRTYRRRDLSRAISFLPQGEQYSPGFSVRQMVAMGRFPHSGGWSESPEDRRAINRALEECICIHLTSRHFNTLSGGERQRVVLAATLAQETPVLALDEPSAHADPLIQATMFALMRQKAAAGITCIAAVHDINLAITFASRIILLDQGRILYNGSAAALLHSSAFKTVFGPRIEVRQDSAGRGFAAYSADNFT